MNLFKSYMFDRKINRLRKQGLNNLVELFDTIKYIENLPQI